MLAVHCTIHSMRVCLEEERGVMGRMVDGDLPFLPGISSGCVSYVPCMHQCQLVNLPKCLYLPPGFLPENEQNTVFE